MKKIGLYLVIAAAIMVAFPTFVKAGICNVSSIEAESITFVEKKGGAEELSAPSIADGKIKTDTNF